MGAEPMRNLMSLVQGPALTPRLCGVVLLLYLLGWQSASAAAHRRYTQTQILEAIFQVESGGRLDPPRGDQGRALGPFQIHEAYWFDSGVPGDYVQCRDRDYAELVVIAYMRRYAREAWDACDAETIARTHNGGPRGPQKQATWAYWLRVRDELARLQ